jgi:hypothetical protein
MKDSLAILRLKRLTMLGLGHLRHLLWKSLPYLVPFFIGMWVGALHEDARIHEDCKYTDSFRINTTGYTCNIGK